ncbi:hypothetical protein JCM15519_19790 [Fundidesulfovibrio butyratiphilus]
MPKILAVLALFLLCGCSLMGSSEPKEQVMNVIDYGVYQKGLLVRTTDAIPRQLGTTFGLRVQVSDKLQGDLNARIVTDTPGLLDPHSGKTQTAYITKTTLKAGQTYDVFFTFSERWEMAAGTWTLSVETDKGESVSRKFEVYDPHM